mmetsp:Transcript_55270/g.63205  ORF Transcript_55270/g.63205 Transcript_55270/m.63205 type:complete len:117 (+) Transcript_55270:643-993(+)
MYRFLRVGMIFVFVMFWATVVAKRLCLAVCGCFLGCLKKCSKKDEKGEQNGCGCVIGTLVYLCMFLCLIGMVVLSFVYGPYSNFLIAIEIVIAYEPYKTFFWNQTVKLVKTGLNYV